jgi:hypothetical protein
MIRIQGRIIIRALRRILPDLKIILKDQGMNGTSMNQRNRMAMEAIIVLGTGTTFL